MNSASSSTKAAARLVDHCLSRCLGSADMVSPPLQPGWRIAQATLHCGAGHQRLGGLFDVFFERYWIVFTQLRQVEWRSVLCGAARVRLLRRNPDTKVDTLVAQWQGRSGAEPLTLALGADLVESAAGMLLIEIDMAEGAIFTDMAWYAQGQCPRDVRLGIVITTYNREDFVARNVRTVLDQPIGCDLIVVNHGQPGLQSRIAASPPERSSLRIIDQENTGGAGGFTRGIVEHRRAGRTSHVVLMDDDIDMAADIVLRIAGVLAWADERLCLGGAMFDYHERTKLFTAGDVLVPGSFRIGHVVPDHGCDVAEAEGVDFLALQHAPDFNGWWCFAFPIKAVDHVGLPMPCFIRGDDVEFGYRLKRAGWPTLGWPGVAVWHMPFAQKSAAWHMFYDRRNNLFMNEIHARLSRWQAAGKMIGGFVHHLLRFDYDRAGAMIDGIRAFNQGPVAMRRWSHAAHQALVEQSTKYARRAEHAAAGAAPQLVRALVRATGTKRTALMIVRLARDVLLPWRRIALHALLQETEWRPDYRQRPSYVIERCHGGESHFLYCWAASAGLFVGFVLCLARYLARPRRFADIHPWPAVE